MLIDGALLPSWVWPLLAGPFVGSFLGVLVRRLPHGRPVALARSCCESCGHVLGPTELVPIASYFWLRGRCGSCHAAIAPQHFAIELAATGLAGWAAIAGETGAALWGTCVFGWALLALGWIDWGHLRLPDVLTLPLLLLGLVATLWLDRAAAAEHALAAALGYGLFRLVAVGYRMARGRDGLGEGDAKLMAALGAWLGLEALSQVLLIAAGLGLAFGLARLVRRGGGLSAAIPFGPFLAAAGWLSRLYLTYP